MGMASSALEDDFSRKRRAASSPTKPTALTPKIHQKYAPVIKRIMKNRSLNLSGMGLDEFPQELMPVIEYYQRSEDINIREVSFVCNNFEYFPVKVFETLHSWKMLDVYDMNISMTRMLSVHEDEDEDLYDWGSLFPNLQYFTCHSNYIQHFPDSLGNCKKLSHVDIRSNPCIDCEKFVPFLSDLSLCNISSLKVLKMGSCFNYMGDPNAEIHVPASLLELHQVSLQEIEMEYNRIFTFCRDVDEPIVMFKLTDIVLVGNELSELNPKVFNGDCLPVLENLVLINNKLTSLPDEICTITSMERLFLNQNKLKCLPEAIGGLHKLQHLECADNCITHLPTSLSQLTNLQYFDFTDNQIVAVDDEILTKLKKLQDFNIAGNKLSNNTCSLSIIGKQMKRLICLNIGYNKFTSIDELFDGNEDGLPRLDTLIISGNRIESVPDMLLSRTPKLARLYAGNNLIAHIKPDLFSSILQKVQHVSLVGNLLTENIFPLETESSELYCSLLSLNLSHNRINMSAENVQVFVQVLTDLAQEEQSILELLLEYNLSNGSEGSNDVKPRAITAGTAHIRGERPSMEDSYIIQSNVDVGDESIHVELYAVFDGHSGNTTSNFVAAALPSALSDAFKDFVGETYESVEQRDKVDALILCKALENVDNQVKDNGYIDGCTAIVTMFVRLVDSDLMRCTVANIGDSRVVLAERNEESVVARRLTVDHKPTTISEKKRISQLGGVVHEGRINGYAVSRSLGDHKERPFISSEPYVNSFIVEPCKHLFLILACDGVWDVVKDQQAAEHVFHSLSIANDNTDCTTLLAKCASSLCDYSYALRSMDNISSTIIKITGSN